MPKQLLRIGLSIGISFAILAFLLNMLNSGLPDEQRPSVFSALKSTSLELVGVFVLISFISLFIRAWRYRLLIIMSGEQNVPTLRQMALVTGVRNMVVDMLPARLGELGYVGLLNRGYGVKLQHCVSSLTVAVAFDFVALLVVVILLIAKQFSGAEVAGWAVGALIMAFVLSAIALIGLFVITPWFNGFISKHFPAKQADSWWAKLLTLLDDFCASLASVRAARKTTQIVGLSVLIRLLKYFSFYLLFIAVAKPSFAQLAELPTEHVVSALIGGEIGASLPIPTFMSFGAYEAGSALVFNLLGIADQAQAVVTMLCVHIWSQAMDYTLGGLLLVAFFWIKRRGEKQASSIESTRTAVVVKWASYAGGAAVLGLGSMFLAYQIWAASKLGALSAPDAGGVSEDAAQWQELSKQHVSSLDGFVVFSSNRDGNHDIFRLNLGDFKLDKLTTHPHTETYPRISPDGKRLVFARAHQVWVSQRNNVAWDVYVLDIESGKEKLVGKNGTAPAWVSKDEITFAQGGVRVILVNVDTDERQAIFESGIDNRLPKGTHIQNPKYNSTTDQFAFTARQTAIGTNTGHWGTAVTFGNTHKGMFNGCELAWDAAGESMFQVNPGGPDGTLHIIEVDPETQQSTTLINLKGEFTHEYWPKDSANNSGYMVFGASRSRKEHEHDTEDYEIFLWKKGTDSGGATRLTFHTGNDNWPDVYIEN